MQSVLLLVVYERYDSKDMETVESFRLRLRTQRDITLYTVGACIEDEM